MKLKSMMITGFFILSVSVVFAADEFKSVKIGDAEVVFNFRPMNEGVAILTVSSLVYENNDSLRGIKNSDQRRISKLGQLIYQCRLLVYKPDKSVSTVNLKDPFMESKNYSLNTDVDFTLTTREKAEIQVQTLQVVDEKSLFTSTLGTTDFQQEFQDYVGEGERVNLKQLDLKVLQKEGILEAAESVDVTVRFPVFQLEQPVNQWHYSFNLKDFNKAIKYTDENCTPAKLMDLVNSNSQDS